MRSRSSILKDLLALLLVTSLGLALGMPVDERLILCVGADGHVDFSFDLPAGAAKANLNLAAEGPASHRHHGECDDTELDIRSVDVDKPVLKNSRENASRQVDAPRSFELPHLQAYPATATFSFDPRESSQPSGPASSIVSLRTTTLLI